MKDLLCMRLCTHSTHAIQAREIADIDFVRPKG